MSASVNVYHSLPRDLGEQKVVADAVRPVPLGSLLRKDGPVRAIKDKLRRLEVRKPDYYTGPPWKLLFDDIILFMKNAIFLPGIVLPLWSHDNARPFQLENNIYDRSGFVISRLSRRIEAYAQRYFHSGPLDELYPSLANIRDITFHVILFVTQATFLLSLPFLSFISFNILTAYIIGFVTLNYFVCYCLNGFMPSGYIQSTDFPEAAQWDQEHPNEQWIFLNGVAVGYVFSQSF